MESQGGAVKIAPQLEAGEAEAEMHLVVPKGNSARGMKDTPPEEGEDQEEPSPEGSVESVPTIREDVSGDVPVLSVRVSECVSEAREIVSVVGIVSPA